MCIYKSIETKLHAISCTQKSCQVLQATLSGDFYVLFAPINHFSPLTVLSLNTLLGIVSVAWRDLTPICLDYMSTKWTQRFALLLKFCLATPPSSHFVLGVSISPLFFRKCILLMNHFVLEQQGDRAQCIYSIYALDNRD